LTPPSQDFEHLRWSPETRAPAWRLLQRSAVVSNLHSQEKTLAPSLGMSFNRFSSEVFSPTFLAVHSARGRVVQEAGRFFNESAKLESFFA
jgi:hypothetical protein